MNFINIYYNLAQTICNFGSFAQTKAALLYRHAGSAVSIGYRDYGGIGRSSNNNDNLLIYILCIITDYVGRYTKIL